RRGGTACAAPAGNPSAVASRNGAAELGLVHLRPALDPQLAGALVQLPLARPGDVDPSGRPLGPVPRGCARLGALLVGRPLSVLQLPVVALLLGDVLHRGERRAMGALLGVVLLVGVVERLR